jgi:hypothetical protein
VLGFLVVAVGVRKKEDMLYYRPQWCGSSLASASSGSDQAGSRFSFYIRHVLADGAFAADLQVAVVERAEGVGA